jgi:soluble lytic murein transglycosylase
MIGMAEKSGRKWRTALAIILCIALAAAAAALGSIWALYRSYPYNYKATIEENTTLYGQDPLFIAAVILTESSWNPKAVSSVGATGLMQVMPATGNWIASMNGWQYADGMLYDSDYNIRLGCWYMDYLAKKFGGDKTLMLAAYNAGENVVNKWVSEGRFGEGFQGIPYAETRSFVRKVLDAYEKYKFLYKRR